MVCVCLFQIYLTCPITLLLKTVEPQKGVNFLSLCMCVHAIVCMLVWVSLTNRETLLLGDALKAQAVKEFPFTNNIKC